MISAESTSNNKEWAPILIETGKPFPFHVFPGWLVTLCFEIAMLIGLDVEYVAAVILGVVSAAVVGRIGFQVSKTQFVRAQEYICTVGSASAGKSPAIEMLSKPLADFIRNTNKKIAIANKAKAAIINSLEYQKLTVIKSKVSIVEKEAELTQIARDMQDNKPLPLCEELLSNTSPEGLRDILLLQDGRGIILTPEASLILTLLDQHAGIPFSSPELYQAGFNGEPASIMRVSKGLMTLESVNLSILIGAQPFLAKSMMTNETLIDNGIVARFLYCFPKNDILAPEIEAFQDSKLTDYWNGIILDLARRNRSCQASTSPSKLICDQDTSTYFYEISRKYRGESGTTYADVEAYAGKAKTHIAKLSCLLALINDPAAKVVSLDDALNATDLYEYFISQYRSIYDSSALSDNETIVLRSLIRCSQVVGNGNVTEMAPYAYIKEQSAFKGEKGKTFYRSILQHLLKRGYIRVVASDQSQRGRATVRYEINPGLLTK